MGQPAPRDQLEAPADVGPSFVDGVDHQLPALAVGSLAPRHGIGLARGPVQAVEVVYDTTVEGGRSQGSSPRPCSTEPSERPS
ncbi:hypothetical protein [Cellulomonas sp. URHD0024]|uniref:hypothetical protein n=1 Tax=Cellulomonas sp. URHD0024 TaxID=1302620 RepID=UPI00040A1F6E|nr:hypothetical protein [Cellulomonas sp. URHD0024]